MTSVVNLATTPATTSLPLSVSDNASEHEWDTFVETHPGGSVDHRWRWQQVFASVFSHDSVYLVARRGDAVAGVLPLVRFRSRLFGRFVVSVPFLNYGGVLAHDAETVAALINQARIVASDFRASHIELRHVARQTGDLAFRSHKLQLRRQLPATTEQLWNTLDKKVRNQVRKAQKEGLVADVGGAELVPAFYDVFSRNMRDLGTPVYSARLFSEALCLFPECAQVYIVRSASRPIAASVTFRHRDTVLVPWASSLREFRAQCPNMLLYWTMLENAVHGGATTFDFGRSTPGAGTHAFKLQWGAQEAPLHWEYALVSASEAPHHGADNPKFAAAIATWQRLPLWLTRAIGPAIVRNIP